MSESSKISGKIWIFTRKEEVTSEVASLDSNNGESVYRSWFDIPEKEDNVLTMCPLGRDDETFVIKGGNLKCVLRDCPVDSARMTNQHDLVLYPQSHGVVECKYHSR